MTQAAVAVATDAPALTLDQELDAIIPRIFPALLEKAYRSGRVNEHCFEMEFTFNGTFAERMPIREQPALRRLLDYLSTTIDGEIKWAQFDDSRVEIRSAPRRRQVFSGPHWSLYFGKLIGSADYIDLRLTYWRGE